MTAVAPLCANAHQVQASWIENWNAQNEHGLPPGLLIVKLWNDLQLRTTKRVAELDPYQLGMYDTFIDKNPWCRFVTLELRGKYQRMSWPRLQNHLLNYARRINRQIRSRRFKFIWFEERAEHRAGYRHIHGLVYFDEPKTNEDFWFGVCWRKQGSAVVEPIRPERGGVGGALAYCLKDFTVDRNFYASDGD